MSANGRSFMRWLSRVAGSTVLLVFAAATSFAAPITYTFTGPVSGTLGGTPFTNAQITITATGDTSLPDTVDCVPGGPTCYFLSSVSFTIAGVGSGTVTDTLFIFVFNPNSALGLERTGAGGDWVDITHPQFLAYPLNTCIGPVVATAIGSSPFGTVATTAGVLALTSNPNTFQAVTTVCGSPVAPTISKSFATSNIPLNGSTSLSFTITNPNTSTLTAVGFTDSLPAGLVVTTPNGLTGSCGGGSITAVAGSGSVSLAGATLGSSASCTFSVNVTGTIAGTKNNTTGAVTSAEGGTGNTASASVTVAAAVIAPPTIATSFGAANILLNQSTSLSFTVTNPNTSTLTGVGFGDSLPAGLVVSTPNGVAGTCGGGTITTVAGSGSISLAGATLGSSASCTFSVNVTGISAGTKINTTGAVNSSEGGTGGTASASLLVTTVVTAPTTTAIPTLQEWAILLLALLMTVAAAVRLRSHRKE